MSCKDTSFNQAQNYKKHVQTRSQNIHRWQIASAPQQEAIKTLSNYLKLHCAHIMSQPVLLHHCVRCNLLIHHIRALDKNSKLMKKQVILPSLQFACTSQASNVLQTSSVVTCCMEWWLAGSTGGRSRLGQDTKHATQFWVCGYHESLETYQWKTPSQFLLKRITVVAGSTQPCYHCCHFQLQFSILSAS